MSKGRLRIGVMVDCFNIPNWQYEIIKQLYDSAYSTIIVIIKNTDHENDSKSFFSRLLDAITNKIIQLHLQLDKLILYRISDYDTKSNLKNLIQNAKQLQIKAFKKGTNFQLCKSDSQQLENYNLDIILKLDNLELIGNLEKFAKNGVWFLDSANNNKYGFHQLGYWEVVNKEETTFTVLKVLHTDSNECKVIYQSSLLTSFISISKNRNACYWRASKFIPRIIEGLHNYGESYLNRLQERFKWDEHFYKDKNQTIGVIDVCSNVFIHFKNVFKRFCQKLIYQDYWFVLFYINTKYYPTSLESFQMLPTPCSKFWADPFVVYHQSKYYIFVEELIYRNRKAHIAVIELDKNGRLIRSKKVLEQKYHLSYPFIFEFEGTYFMIPESAANRTIELYKCIKFPYEWMFVMNLMENVDASDVTLFYYNNKWWLFCCIDTTGRNVGMLDELHLFYSNDLFSTEWKSHPDNPIDTNSKSARPAGKIFIKEGKIFRPSQNCTGMYGQLINLNEIVVLTETDYKEEKVSQILPDSRHKMIGTHTYNFANGITVVDGFKYRKRPLFKSFNSQS